MALLPFGLGRTEMDGEGDFKKLLSITVVTQIKDRHTLVGCGRRSEA